MCYAFIALAGFLMLSFNQQLYSVYVCTLKKNYEPPKRTSLESSPRKFLLKSCVKAKPQATKNAAQIKELSKQKE